MDSTEALLKALIARLQDVLQAKLGGRVFTDVPQGGAFPYLVVSVEAQPFAANDFSGQSHTVRLQVFSQQSTPNEALIIRRLAQGALDRQEENIAVQGHSLVKSEYSGSSVMFKEDDGKTWQAVCEIEMVVV